MKVTEPSRKNMNGRKWVTDKNKNEEQKEQMETMTGVVDIWTTAATSLNFCSSTPNKTEIV